jgi:hypothetical protein
MFSVVWDIQTSISSNRQDIENTIMERYYLQNLCPQILLISGLSSASRNIRREALQKIAALSATSASTMFDSSDLERLSRGCSNNGTAKSKSNGYGKGGLVSMAASPMVYQELSSRWA